jgi:hypothetical protein
MTSNRLLAKRSRIVAGIVLAGGIVFFVLQVIVGIGREPDSLAAHVYNWGPAAGYLLGAIALAGLLRSAAELLSRPVELSHDVMESIERIEESMREIRVKMADLSGPGEMDEDEPRPIAPPSLELPAAPSAPQASNDKVLERLIQVLEEVREISMMSEQERSARLQLYRERRKDAAIEHVAHCIGREQWARAERSQKKLDEQFPLDEKVQTSRRNLDEHRAVAEQKSAQRIFDRVEDLMALSSWDEALTMATNFAENFPTNPDGQRLLERVRREKQLFSDGMVHRVYDEVKEDLEHRNWKRALAGAQRLLERFPTHAKSQKIRVQLATIQENAEIQERQEQEARIQDLIRSRRFAEAIQIAENLIERFPLSPQAEELTAMLPALRQRAIQHEADVMGNR